MNGTDGANVAGVENQSVRAFRVFFHVAMQTFESSGWSALDFDGDNSTVSRKQIIHLGIATLGGAGPVK